MKRMKKILPLLICVIIAVFALTGCDMTSSEQETQTVSEIREMNLETVENFTNNNFATILTTYTPEIFAYSMQSNGTIVNPIFDNAFLTRWQDFVDEHGNVTNVDTDEVKRDGTEYTARMVLTGEDGQLMTMTITYDEQLSPYNVVLENYSNDDSLSVGEKMGNAAGNIIVGLLVVFAALIVLSLLISAFGVVGKIGNKKEEPAPAQAKAPAPAPATAAVVKEEDNKELIAIIAAAIAAAEGTSPNGFVVRSIRRLDSNKWR